MNKEKKILSYVPDELQKHFVQQPIKFEVSKFEEIMLLDLYEYDESSKIKLNRNVTKEFFDEIKLYKKQKRNIRYSIKGETRDGKSLGSMKLGDTIMDQGDSEQDFNKEIEKIVCGNQIEYRRSLRDAKFGDFFLVDENLFQRGGLGANVEASQLKDYNAIIAKKNIDVIYINPETFLNVGATLGLSTYGRDPKNWYTRFLVYKFKDTIPFLIGYIILDVGSLFRKYGCYVYKFTGGCTNSKKISIKNIPEEVLNHTTCFDKKESDKLNKEEVTSDCPFYNICSHALCRYEKKKDSWIEKEMKGGLDERTYERFFISIKIISSIFKEYDEEDKIIKLRAKNGKDLKNRVRLLAPKFTNTKFSIGEFDELVEIVKTNCDIHMLCETIKSLENDKEALVEDFNSFECYQEIKKKCDL